jgi:pimeloyl-ACP methyl ester carboxylesterase
MIGMRDIELSCGTIAYEDTGGDGPTVLLLHGWMMDASLWDRPIADLSADHRCLAPTLPFGAHRHPMSADADLSLPGIARLVAEFLDRLDLTTSHSSATTPVEHSSNCSCATGPHVWDGLCSSHATRSTTSRRA